MVILSGKPSTIRDVARASGVSSATVSYVINDGPRPVAPKTAARVREAIVELNFHPSLMARALNKKRIGCLGVVLPKAAISRAFDPYYGAILGGITRVATERQNNVTLFTGSEWTGRASLAMFRDRLVDGLLLIGVPAKTDIASCLSDAGVPFVLINQIEKDGAVNSVDTDNFEAVRRVVHHLTALGHGRVAYLGADPSEPGAAQRRQGYIRGLQEHAMRVNPALIIEAHRGAADAYDNTLKLLNLHRPPTAIIAGMDCISTGIYRACDDCGARIPEDLSVIGFDNGPYAKDLRPGLTTVHTPLVEIGATAADLLMRMLDAIETGMDRPAEQIVLPSEIIMRESVGAPQNCSVTAKRQSVRRVPIGLLQGVNRVLARR